MRTVVAALASLALIAPATAVAAPREIETRGTTLRPTPQLAGPDVLYQTSADDRATQIRAMGPGGDRLVRRFTPLPQSGDGSDSDDITYSFNLSFAASANALATLTTATQSTKGVETQRSVDFDYGPLAGPYQLHNECQPLFAAAVDASRVALTRCSGDGRRVEVRDTVSGAIVATIDDATAEAIAGDFVAFHRGDEMVVWNYATGAEAYRLPSRGAEASLQPDGKLAHMPLFDANGDFIFSDGCSTLAWYSPSEPTAHPLPGCARPRAVRMARDRIMWAASDSAQGDRELVVSDLAGNRRTVAGAIFDFDFDGSRAVYACDMTTYVDDLSEPLDPTTCTDEAASGTRRGCHPDDPTARIKGSRRCPVRVRGGMVEVDPRRRAVLRVECPVGCQGSVRLRRRVGPRWRWVSRRVALNVPYVRTRRVRVPLTTAGPTDGPGYLVQAVARSRNRTVGPRTSFRNYTKTIRLVRARPGA